MTKIALITGITGQDGSYLAELLLEKGYEVHGIKRRTSSRNVSRIEHLFANPAGIEGSQSFILHHGDLTDGSSLQRIIHDVRPDEIYNLAAQSHVKVSFEEPEYTANSDALGVLRLLEVVRSLKDKPTRFYQASTSELFGGQDTGALNESSKFDPRSPYAAAKLYAFNISKIYRKAYGLFASNGILFNHESPRRGENFVTKKITRGIADILLGKQSKLSLGNLDAVRDWGHAKDYVYAQWLILQQPQPDDFVIATGNAISVREFLSICFDLVGITIAFVGKGVNEKIVLDKTTTPKIRLPACRLDDMKAGMELVEVSPLFFRPLEVDHLLGDASKARKTLGWEPQYSVSQLAEEMMIADLAGR